MVENNLFKRVLEEMLVKYGSEQYDHLSVFNLERRIVDEIGDIPELDKPEFLVQGKELKDAGHTYVTDQLESRRASRRRT